jgi:3-isopropylmalate/(R)-2-methylmalate dehydratase small subunit
MASVIAVLGNDVSTDVIYPGRFMATVLPGETPPHAFADDPVLGPLARERRIPPGSVIVAGVNFGCGSSREQAASCLKGHGLVVVARSFARIFLDNAVNVGLRVVTAPRIAASPGDVLELGEREVVNQTSGGACAVEPLAPARQAVLEAGGLVPYVRRRLAEPVRPAPEGRVP